jgi:hypothetical protein
MSKKIEEQELANLKEKVSNINSLQMQIGGLEAQKHELLHGISLATTEFQNVQKELQDKYGKVSINISTGEISEDEFGTKN